MVLPRWVEVSSGAVGYTPTVVHGAEPAVSAAPGQNVTELYGAGMPVAGSRRRMRRLFGPLWWSSRYYVPDEVVEDEEPASFTVAPPAGVGRYLGF